MEGVDERGEGGAIPRISGDLPAFARSRDLPEVFGLSAAGLVAVRPRCWPSQGWLAGPGYTRD